MKPGGVCSPGSRQPLPPGDGVGAAPLPHKLSEACAQFSKDPATLREGRACLTPDLYEEGGQGARPAPHSPLNGLLSQVALLNGAYQAPFATARECQVLSPPQSEDGEEDRPHPCPSQHGVGHRPEVLRVPGNPTTLPSGLPGICGKRYEQLTVITADTRGQGGAPTTDPTTTQQPSAPCPSSSSAGSSGVLGQQSRGGSLSRGPALASPKSLKSPRGKRKCSLEEIMNRLHHRNSEAQSRTTGANALQNFPSPAARLAGLPWGSSVLGDRCSESAEAPSTTTTTTTCDNSNAAPFLSVHPRGQVTQGSGLRTPQGDCSPNPSSSLCGRTPSVASNSSPPVTAPSGPLPSVSKMSVALDAGDPGKGALIPTSKEDLLQGTAVSSNTEKQKELSVALGVSVCAPAVLSSPANPQCSSPCDPTQAVLSDEATEKITSAPGGEEGDRNSELCVGSPTGEPNSGRSSSVEVLEGDGGCGGSRGSESDIEVLFDSTHNTHTATTTPQREEEVAEDSTGALSGIPKDADTPKVTGVTESQGAASVTYLEPISEDENSLLTSDLSSASGVLSNSNTPMFSDTPSDASRGALMVKISDAVAAILSDVSDESLPDSPLASSSNSADGFPSSTHGGEKLSKKIASICEKLDRDCGREGLVVSSPTTGPATQPSMEQEGAAEGVVVGGSSSDVDNRTNLPCPPIGNTVFPPIQKEHISLSLVPCVALSSSSSASSPSPPSPPSPSSSPPPPLPLPPNQPPPPPLPPQTCKGVLLSDSPVRQKQQQLEVPSPPSTPSSGDVLQPDPLRSTTSLPSSPPQTHAGEVGDGGKLAKEKGQQTSSDLRQDEEEEGEVVGLSVSLTEPTSSPAPVHPCRVSPDITVESPSLPSLHVPHTDLGTNYYSSRSLNADNNSCQNHISGSQTISSQSRFCNITSGDGTKEEDGEASIGVRSPPPPVEAPTEYAFPQRPTSPSLSPSESSTQMQDLPLKPLTTGSREVDTHTHTPTNDAPSATQESEAHTRQLGMHPYEDPVSQRSVRCTGHPPAPSTEGTQEQSSSEGTVSSCSCKHGKIAMLAVDHSLTTNSSNSPQENVAETEPQPPKHTHPAVCPAKIPSVVETLPGAVATGARRSNAADQLSCTPLDSFIGNENHILSESCITQDSSSSSSSKTPVVLVEGEEVKETGVGGGCSSLAVIRVREDTQVPHTVEQTSATQHTITSPHYTPHVSVPLTQPNREKPVNSNTTSDKASHDPDSSSTSALPLPSPLLGVPGSPQALCSLGEATTHSLLVHGSLSRGPGECSSEEASLCTSPSIVPQPCVLLPSLGKGTSRDSGNGDGGDGDGHISQAKNDSNHSHSLPCKDDSAILEPKFLANHGVEMCLAEHTFSVHSNSTPPDSTVTLSQPDSTTETSPRVDCGQGNSESHVDLPCPLSVNTCLAVSQPQTVTEAFSHPPDCSKSVQTPIMVEKIHHLPHSTPDTAHTHPEASHLMEGDTSVKSSPHSGPLCASLPHTTAAHTPGEATTPAPALMLPDEHLRDSIESTFHKAKTRTSNHPPGDLPSVKSPTVGVTPDEVTIPQGEPYMALTSEHLSPPTCTASGVRSLTPATKDKAKGLGIGEVTHRKQCQEESQTVCAAVTQPAQHSTAAGQECDLTNAEGTTIPANTTAPDSSAPQQPLTTRALTAPFSPPASDTQHKEAGEVEGVPQLLLELRLVKREKQQLKQEQTGPTQTTSGASVMWLPEREEGKLVCSSAGVGDTETPATTPQEEGVQGKRIEVLGAPCPLCSEVLDVPLERHLTNSHICCTFVHAKTTFAYQHHMLLRVKDPADIPPGEDHYPGSLYVCRCCCFASEDINAVRFHLNTHEEVYQVRPGQVECGCDLHTYSYPSHRWKSLIHRSTHHCHLCGHYFACHQGHHRHSLALHFPAQCCQLCGCQVAPDMVTQHLAQHQLDTAAHDAKQDAQPSAGPNSWAPLPVERFGISWNIHDNWINFLDGKDFRLSTAAKVLDPQLDRSYLTLPLRNVDEEAVVPAWAILDPERDIHRYLKGKRVVRLPGGGEEALRSFSLAVQLEIHKKMNRKGRKTSAGRPRAGHHEDLFTVLGIVATRARALTFPKEASEPTAPRTPGRKPRRKLSLEIPLEEHPGLGPQLTRTRSGMMQTSRAEVPVQDREEEAPAAASGAAVPVVDGEWSKKHTFVCCSCGTSCLDLADMMDHKWEMHPSVWCAHTMLQGEGLVPQSFRSQFQPPTARPCLLPLPSTPPLKEEGQAGLPTSHSPPTHTCTSCHLNFQDVNAFHAHLVECGGLSLLTFPKKKSKKGFRFKRRKGQGMPINRYGNTSQPSTPLKARAGDRSSGLNTPLSDRPLVVPLPTCGVKRRLELAVGSIDNVELKNRLKAIITGSRGPGGSGTGQPGRRPSKMKLRKKALDTRRLRKTRHSDRVKEQKEEKVDVSGEEAKGKTAKKGGAIESLKPVKGKEGKVKGNIKKKKDAKGEEGSQEGMSGPIGAVSDLEEKRKGKIDAATDTDTLPGAEKMQQRVNGFLGNSEKVRKKKKMMKKKVTSKYQVPDEERQTLPVPEPSLTSDSTSLLPPPPHASEKKKGKKTLGKRKIATEETVMEGEMEEPVKGTNKTAKTPKSEKRQLEETEMPLFPSSPSQTPQEPGSRPRKVQRTSSVETNTSSVKEDEEEETETTAGDDEDEEEEEEMDGATEDSEWISDSKDEKDALRPKRQAYFSSSSEDTENSDDSEPEVIRNFRSGRQCGGRTGLRNKRSQANSRYSFRTCFTSRKKDSDNSISDKDRGKTKKLDYVDDEDEELEENEALEDLPLTPKRKRKIANYENQDDYTYIPNESSSDVDYMDEVSEEEANTDPERSLRESPRMGQSKQRSTRRSLRNNLLKEGSVTSGEGTGPDSKMTHYQETRRESVKQEGLGETKEDDPRGDEGLVDCALGSQDTWGPGSVHASARRRRRSLEVPGEVGGKVKITRTASAPNSDLEGERSASKVPKRKGMALLERLALSTTFQAQVDEVIGKTHRRKKVMSEPQSDSKVTAGSQADFKGMDECTRESTPGRDEDITPKVLRRRKYLHSDNSDSQALESDSSLEKMRQPLGRRRNVIVSSDCSEVETQPAEPPKDISDMETLAEDILDDMPLSLAKKMHSARRNQGKDDPNADSTSPQPQPPSAPAEDDDEDDNIPLSALAHLSRKTGPTAPSNPVLAPGKTAGKQKVSGKSKKRLKVRQLNRLIKESAAQDSESSSFEGFSSGPAKRWGKAKAPTKKYKKKLSLLKTAKGTHSGSTASESEASDDTRTVKKSRKVGASPLITTHPPDTITTAPEKSKVLPGPVPLPSKATTHKKSKSSKKYKKGGGKGGKGVRSTKNSPKGTVSLPGPPQTMPVLKCMVGVGTSLEGGYDPILASDATSEPARVMLHQSSDSSKDIPSVPRQQPPDLVPATSDALEEGQHVPSSPLPLPQELQQSSEYLAMAPQPRKKRARSSQELPLKDAGGDGSNSLPSSLPPPLQPPPPPPVPQSHNKVTEVAGTPKKVGKRKRSVSVSGAVNQETQEAPSIQSQALTTTATAATNTTTTSLDAAAAATITPTSKKSSEGAKKKKNASASKAAKAEVNELTCVECGLKFGSVASLEDHRQDCLTIAFEMSMMEAEDHLFECPHCHLTFAKKGTQRKHTTSCRLVKYKRYESKAFKKAGRCPPTPGTLMLPGGEAGVVVPPAPLPSSGKGRKSSKENISGEVLPGAPDPLLKEVLRVPVYTRHSDKVGAVLTGGNTLQENVKHQELLQRVPPLTVPDAAKARRDTQLSRRMLNGEHPDPFPGVPPEEPQRCSVCGYETSDPDVSAKHRLILQFSRCCQQQAVREVCALAANYNLGLDAVRGMVAAAASHQSFITLAFDPKQQPTSLLNPLMGSAASTTAKLKEVLASPHCAWVLSSLESLVKHYQTSDAVNITGTRQDALKTVSALEEVLKDISEADGALLRNRMLKSMRETFEAGTLS